MKIYYEHVCGELGCGEIYNVSITNLGITVQVDIENLLKLPELAYQVQTMNLYRLVQDAKGLGWGEEKNNGEHTCRTALYDVPS